LEKLIISYKIANKILLTSYSMKIGSTLKRWKNNSLSPSFYENPKRNLWEKKIRRFSAPKKRRHFNCNRLTTIISWRRKTKRMKTIMTEEDSTIITFHDWLLTIYHYLNMYAEHSSTKGRLYLEVNQGNVGLYSS
jgi:hypothetical protein